MKNIFTVFGRSVVFNDIAGYDRQIFCFQSGINPCTYFLRKLFSGGCPLEWSCIFHNKKCILDTFKNALYPEDYQGTSRTFWAILGNAYHLFDLIGVVFSFYLFNDVFHLPVFINDKSGANNTHVFTAHELFQSPRSVIFHDCMILIC